MLSKLRFEAFYLKHKATDVWPDKAAMWLAWALPRRVAMWAYIRVMAHATTGPYGDRHPDEVTYKMACDAWAKGEHPTPDDPLEDGYYEGSAFEPIAVPSE